VVAANITTNRRMSSTHRHIHGLKRDVNVVYGRNELDSHADTIALGKNSVIMQYTDRECHVAPYSDAYEPMRNVPIVTGATAITNTETGETTILVFNEAIWMGNQLDHSLLNPNQLRHHGIVVQDNPYDDTLLQLLSHDDEITIPMHADGTTIYFASRTPTDFELSHSRHVHLTSNAPWNPRDVQFPITAHHAEQAIYHTIGNVCRFDLSRQGDDDDHITRLIANRPISQVQVADNHQDVPVPRTFASGKRHSDVSAQELSERWFIGLAQVHETIKVTTQNYARSAILPLSRRYRADRVFEKPLLRGDFYTDTMDGRCKSMNGNRYAQVMANKDFFAVAYPMASKSAAGDSLRQFINEYGRPEKLTFDGSQEQCGKKTEFMQNVRKYSINYHVTEPHRPNHNFAEGVIREIREKWYRIVVRKISTTAPLGLRVAMDVCHTKPHVQHRSWIGWKMPIGTRFW
jgi:hypothetical protein